MFALYFLFVIKAKLFKEKYGLRNEKLEIEREIVAYQKTSRQTDNFYDTMPLGFEHSRIL